MIVPSTSLFIGDFQLPSLIAKGFFSAAGGCTWTLRSPTRINISSAQYRPIQQIDFFPKIGLYRLIINFTVGFSIMNHPSWVHFGTPQLIIYIYIHSQHITGLACFMFFLLPPSLKMGTGPKGLETIQNWRVGKVWPQNYVGSEMYLQERTSTYNMFLQNCCI